MLRPANLLFIVLGLMLSSCEKDDIEPVNNEEVRENRLPEVTTNEVGDINVFSVYMSCSLENEGASEVSEIGIVVGTSPGASLQSNFNKFILSQQNEAGDYYTLVSSLPEKVTTFYIKAYAINEDGVGYGNEVEFTTLGNKTYYGNPVLKTQEEVMEFGENAYNTINGSLTIEGSVSDLSPLKDLFAINSELEIENTTNLKDFKGLENLRRIGARLPNGFSVRNNRALVSFEGLNNLELTRGDFYIINNDELKNLKGLDSYFAASAGALRIQNCDKLTSLEGLENLEFIGLELALQDNLSLVDISALGKLDFLGSSIIITENESLAHLRGMENLTDVPDLYLRRNPSLSDLDAIKKWETLGSLFIGGNRSLFNLPQFENLTEISNISINNSEIKDLTGLGGINEIGIIELFQSKIQSLEGISGVSQIGFLDIYECQNIQNLIGMEGVGEIEDLKIRNCFNFSSLEGFTLETIGDLALVGTALNDLSGLESLKIIKNNLKMNMNESLESVKGLENIEEIENLWIDGNSSLTNIDNFKNLKSLNYLLVLNNKSLKNLEGFNNIESINELAIQNSYIESLEGLDNLKTINKRFQATHNFYLKDFCALSTAMENFTGTYTVYTNSYDPGLEDLQNGDCN